MRGDGWWSPSCVTRVWGVAMGCHHHGDPPHTLVTQEGDHHPSPRITLRRPWAAIDHDPAAVGRPEGGSITLAHVQEEYRQATAGVECDNVTEGRRDENRGHKRRPRCDQPRAARGIP